MPSRRQNLVSEDPHASTSSKDSTQRCLAGGAKHTVKQRASVCGGRPLQNWSLCSRSTIKCSSSCAKYWREGLLHCTCGTCLMPSEQKRKIKSQIEILSIRCKAWTSRMAMWSLQSERFQTRCEKKVTRFHLAKVARWRSFPKFSNCRRMGWRILSICGLPLVNWFHIHSYKNWAWKMWEQSYSWRQWSRTQVGTNEEQTRYLTCSSPSRRYEKPYFPKHWRFRPRPIEEKERSERQWTSWGQNKWSQSSSSSSTWWTPQEWQEWQE